MNAKKALHLKILYAKSFRLFFLISGFIFLIVLRQVVGCFGVSLGYLYVTLICLSGFWFGVRGGITAAFAASAIFLVEVYLFRDWPARDVVVNGIPLRFFVYFLGGGMLGYLAALAEARTRDIQGLDVLKNKFVGMAAHDLRNPVAVICNCAAMLGDGESKLSEDKRTRLIEIVKRSSSHMLDLINDLLDITRIESGKVNLNLTSSNYPEFVRENIEFNQVFADKKKIVIELVCGTDIPPVVFDSEKITQVFNNLISNAVKYTYSGTKIKVEIKMNAGDVVTSVKDQGQGIPNMDLERIFVEFYRSSSKPIGEAQSESTGLGLAIAKKIIESHGGKISVESELGNGATFYFSLPVSRKGL